MASHGQRLSPYVPLGEHEIRVLRLFPGADGDPLSGSLEHVCLPQNGQPIATSFEAISYAWGSSIKPHDLLIHYGYSIPLTESLEQALRHFRDADSPQVLWADAICIDQDNLRERSHQVSMMAQIYSAADCVLVWLGRSPDVHADRQAVKVAEICGDYIDDYEDGHLDEGETFRIEASSISKRLRYTDDANDSGDDKMDVRKALATIWTWIRRPYFSRLWVVQEYVSAREVWFCSDTFMLPAETMSAAVHAVQDNYYIADEQRYLTMQDDFLLYGASDLLSTPGSVGHKDGVVKKLMLYSSRHCVDPRDRVFAVRNVLSLNGVKELQPDYSVDPADLYRVLMLYLLDSAWSAFNPTLLLALAGSDQSSRRMQLPSWTPNFHNISEFAHGKMNSYSRRPRQCDNQRPRVSWKYDFDYLKSHFQYTHQPGQMHKLDVRGRLFAQVIDPTPLPGFPLSCQGQTRFEPLKYSDFEEFQDWYGSWCQYFRDLFQHSVHQFDLHKELINFLAYPTHWSSEVDAVTGMTEECPEDFWERYANSRRDIGDASYSDTNLREHLSFIRIAVCECPLMQKRRAWRIATKERQDLAWLPQEAQLGDHICVIAGAMWPFVVRPAGDGTYQLIGDCHTYSIPLIEALGGVYDEEMHGDGHWYDYFNSRPAEYFEKMESSQDARRQAGQNVEFVRGEILAFNMPGLRYDDLIAKMDYLTLV